MPEYLFYTVDGKGLFDEYLGHGFGENSRQAYADALPVDEDPDEIDHVMKNVYAVRTDETLNHQQIKEGAV